jgi:ribonuclease PH
MQSIQLFTIYDFLTHFTFAFAPSLPPSLHHSPTHPLTHSLTHPHTHSQIESLLPLRVTYIPTTLSSPPSLPPSLTHSLTMLTDCYVPQYLDSPTPESESPSSSPSSSIKLELGLIHNVSGSAYLDFGGTKVICSVHGPYARTASGGVFHSTGQLECDLKYATSSSSSSSSSIMNDKTYAIQSQTVIDALQSSIRLEKYAKMTIMISIVVLETQGCELANVICCASLALLDSGIEMLDLVCASSAVKQSDGVVIFNPNRDQIANGDGSVTVATSPTTGDITQIWYDGKDDLASSFSLIQECSDRNVILRQSFRENILSRASK